MSRAADKRTVYVIGSVMLLVKMTCKLCYQQVEKDNPSVGTANPSSGSVSGHQYKSGYLFGNSDNELSRVGLALLHSSSHRITSHRLTNLAIPFIRPSFTLIALLGQLCQLPASHVRPFTIQTPHLLFSLVLAVCNIATGAR